MPDPRKTYAQLGLETTVQDTDLLATWRSSGPLKRITATTLKTYFQGGVALLSSLAASSGSTLIGWIAAGTGATARTVQAKLRDFVSVKDFGAVGDGVTDDTAAFSAAIAAAEAIYVPGTTASYLVSSEIVINRTLCIWGDGENSRINTSSASANIFRVTAQLVDIQGLAFGSTVVRTSGYYVDFDSGCNRSTLYNYWMFGAINGVLIRDSNATITVDKGRMFDGVGTTGVAIRVDGGFDVSIRDIITDQGSQLFAGVYITECGDILIQDCQIIRSGQAVFGDVSGSGNNLNSCWIIDTFGDNSTRGVYLKATNSGRIERCKIQNSWGSSSGGEGILLETDGTGIIDGIDIHDCHMFLNGSAGIKVVGTGVTNISIHDNSIAGNTGVGIEIDANISGISIQSNRIGSSNGLGANLRAFSIAAGTGDNIIIANNDFRGNTNAPIMGATGTNVLIHDNLGYEFPWRTYTPTVTAGTGTFTTLGTVEGQYVKIDKTLHVTVSIPITTNGTAGQDVRFTLPNSLTGAKTTAFAGEEVNATGNMLKGRVTAASNIVIVTQYDNAYPGGSGRRLVLTGVFEVN